ncbi:RNA polymerase sigma-70 factor, ECF subfamily [Nitrosomonas aestuarii]|uniref:RNA polymerase sigma-70 factor, ECF subfamily n=1 Tax=Nitrosomonas aestuarii TaxID=52441 RepID=A0A1I4AGW3_9PROT|nr:RNA polymerase sigma factor [Nitrosomonas aestuarii]SFK55410.1 RNA polymerase sigma-70 factor, ECF subfamily [Nitrosomonas aestuarii]
MATRSEFSDFLEKVELRAFKQALFAVRDEQDALDIVQDSMMKLTSKYADKPPDELPPLFQRILQNTIHDHYRRQKTRSLFSSLLSTFAPQRIQNEKEIYDYEFSEILPSPSDQSYGKNPNLVLEQSQLIKIIEKALEALPARQREAFLLRYWEGMDVSETSKVMGCSEGSVKTHCSRATNTLAILLKEKGITL